MGAGRQAGTQPVWLAHLPQAQHQRHQQQQALLGRAGHLPPLPQQLPGLCRAAANLAPCCEVRLKPAGTQQQQ
jgi:hypothetical protein